MAGYNKCTWLCVGRAERCGSRCKNTLCGLHRSMQKHRKIEEAHLCRKCGKGTKAESRLCSKACGSDRVKKTLHRAEARARRYHTVLINELLEVAHPCRKCRKGTKAESRLCSKACGADRAQKTLRQAEARARCSHKVLMNELLGLCRCRFLLSPCPCCLSS